MVAIYVLPLIFFLTLLTWKEVSTHSTQYMIMKHMLFNLEMSYYGNKYAPNGSPIYTSTSSKRNKESGTHHCVPSFYWNGYYHFSKKTNGWILDIVTNQEPAPNFLRYSIYLLQREHSFLSKSFSSSLKIAQIWIIHWSVSLIVEDQTIPCHRKPLWHYKFPHQIWLPPLLQRQKQYHYYIIDKSPWSRIVLSARLREHALIFIRFQTRVS